MENIIWYDELDSTNNEARRVLDALDNLSVIAAVGQSAGRGQGDHTWFASPRIFRPVIIFSLPG